MNQGYLTWCDACGWNLMAADPPAPKTGSEMIAAMSAEHGSGEAVTGGRGDRRVRVALALAAVGVYLFVGALAVGGVWLELITFPNPFAMLPVAAMLGAAWYARPRPDSPEPPLLDRADHPVLYELADTLADEVGSARLDGIALTTDYDAWIGRYGWRQRRVVTLGVPLLAVLGPQERAALLAHEIAHERRGDAASLLVGTAGNALAALMELLEPEQMAMVVGERRYQRPSTLSRTVANLGMALICALVKPFVLLFGMLEARHVRRIEAEADRLSAEVAGAAAVRSALIKSRASHTLSTLAASAAAEGDPDVIGRLPPTVDRDAGSRVAADRARDGEGPGPRSTRRPPGWPSCWASGRRGSWSAMRRRSSWSASCSPTSRRSRGSCWSAIAPASTAESAGQRRVERGHSVVELGLVGADAGHAQPLRRE